MKAIDTEFLESAAFVLFVERRYDMIDAISLIREMDDPFNIEISMIEEAVDFFRDNYDWNYPARNQLKRALITVLEENHII